MTRLRVVVVDDEPLARRGIRQLLDAEAGVEVVGEARNGVEAVRVLEALRPDLVFLDVQMPELDGFDVLRRLSVPLPLVVFVTAFDTYAIRAFDAHAVDYLVKPIDEARFAESVRRARERIHADAGRRLLLDLAGGVLLLSTDDILWVEAVDYYAGVHAGGRRHLVRESLAALANRLDGRQFVRAHRQAIVNLAHVAELRAGRGGRASLVLRNGVTIPVSRRRRDAVAAAIRRLAGPGH